MPLNWDDPKVLAAADSLAKEIGLNGFDELADAPDSFVSDFKSKLEGRLKTKKYNPTASTIFGPKGPMAEFGRGLTDPFIGLGKLAYSALTPASLMSPPPANPFAPSATGVAPRIGEIAPTLGPGAPETPAALKPGFAPSLDEQIAQLMRGAYDNPVMNFLVPKDASTSYKLGVAANFFLPSFLSRILGKGEVAASVSGDLKKTISAPPQVVGSGPTGVIKEGEEKVAERFPQSKSKFLKSAEDLVDERFKNNPDPIPPPQTPAEQIRAEIYPETQINPTIQNADKIGYYEKFKAKTGGIWTQTKELVADSQERVRKLFQDPDIINPSILNHWEREQLMSGRLAARIEEGGAMAEGIARDAIATSQSLGMETESFRGLVNRYMQSIHAPERNAVHGEGAAGLTNEQAQAALDEIAGHPSFGPQVARVANQVWELNRQTLQILKEGGVLDQSTIDNLNKLYPNHVPLQRILPDEANIENALGGRRMDVMGTGLKRAKGSELEINDVLGNVVFNYEQALIRSERNLVNLNFLRAYRANKDLFGDFIREQKPKVIGSSGERPIFEQGNDPQILYMRENGKPIQLYIQDPKLAAALKGIDNQKLPALLRVVGTITRWYSGLATRFNPEFAFSNTIRDLPEIATYLASQKEMGIGAGAAAVKREPRSMLDIVDYLRGKNTEGAKLYHQLKMDGGTTGGMGLSTRKQVGLDMDEIFKRLESNPRKAAHAFVKAVDNWNTIFEDATRLSVYREALGRGLSRERAAFLAKNASINFNKMGTGGPVINALYMFSNASTQGSVKMLRAMRNPKTAAAVIGTVGAATWMVDQWNDSIDPDWRRKTSKSDRFNGLTFVLPSTSGFKYAVIPMSWGIKPIKVAMDYASDAIGGHTNGALDAASGILGSMIEAYNPVGGTDFISTITPSVLDLPIDIARNKAWTGNPIRPDWDEYAPASTRYFKSLEKSQTGRLAIAGTKTLARNGVELSPADVNYAYNQIIGGAGQSASKLVNTVSAIGRGEYPLPRDIPFVSRFYRSKTEEETQFSSGYYEAVRKMKTEQSRMNFYKRKAKGK